MGDQNAYDTLIEKIPEIEELICRNALVESLLKDAPSQAAEELSRALVKLYAAILTYLAQASSYYNSKDFSELTQSHHGHRLTNSERCVKYGAFASSSL